MDNETSCPLVDRARRCWMCAYFEHGMCHALPPTAYANKGEVCTVRPKVSLFDLGCSLFTHGANGYKAYMSSLEDKDEEPYYA